MRKSLLILCLGFFFFGCSQKEHNAVVKTQNKTYDINQYIFPEAKDITSENYAEKVLESIKRYDSEPIYYFRINHCRPKVLLKFVKNPCRSFVYRGNTAW